MMRLTTLLALLTLLGCGPSQKSKPEVGVRIVDTFGTTEVEPYKWRVIATEGQKIEFLKVFDEKEGFVGPGLTEAPKKGWFVVVPSADQLWYFNGEDDGVLVQKTPEKTITWGFRKTPMPPPEEFLSRLPAKVRESLAKE